MTTPVTTYAGPHGSLLATCETIARRAGEAILAVYDSDDFAIETKDDDSPLTRADLAANRIIVGALQELEVGPVLSEESAAVPWDERRRWTRYWLVDPLDGTKEFIKRNGEFTVNIALIDDGFPVLGVVHVPVAQRSYVAAEGSGCWRRDGDGEPLPVAVRAPQSEPVTVVGSRSHASPRVRAYLDALGDHELTAMGSSLKFCLVAEGRADLYPRLGPTSEWDTAAAQCVVEQAGGEVTDTALERLRYNRKDSLLNSEFLVFAARSRDWSAFVPDA